ncbi:flagellar filament capping protein FliD [Sporomusa sphaeroides]|uniref:Flagellar capping protein n=1 Tax=Sporomusa sphaeroides DSM 2875 TaxID=1337886 RepID=A0ABP2CHF7_9FIRM|nr:flagellar filament capping protein FliD [Sporomusa sphaeroides]OLS54980.1 flagellar capping protein [Sporomusa sphaeroides DSM 2875]CVK21850.1 flagellar capping protein [Sporomusa sphaeroides DSM 2875]
MFRSGSVANQYTSWGQYGIYASMLQRQDFANNGQTGRTGTLLPGGSDVLYDYASDSRNQLASILADRQKKLAMATEIVENYNNLASSFYNGFDSSMKALKDAAYDLKNTSLNSAVNQIGYGSDNSKVVTVTSKFAPGRDSFNVEVSQLAGGQKTAYAALAAEGAGAFAGKSSLTLNSGDKTYKFDFNFTAGTTNKQALQSIAEKVNESGGSLKASVTEKDGKSQLQLYTSGTGAATAFSVTMTGALEQQLQTERQETAQDAVYRVNGVSHTSGKNEIELAEGVSATLTGTGEAKVSPDQMDAGKLVNAVKQFAGAYNAVVEHLKANAGSSKAISNLAGSFANIRFSAGSLSQLGIDVGAGGKLSVNENRLTEAATNNLDSLQRLVGSSDGIAGVTYNKAFSALIHKDNLLPLPSLTNGYYGVAKGLFFDIMA